MLFKYSLSAVLFVTLGFTLSSCSDSENSEDNHSESKSYQVTGKVEKGPFISGSSISIQPMDSNLQILGESYSSIIQDNTGYFSFGSRTLDSPYAELIADGYFFNEISGELSSGTLSLRAVVDLSVEETVNVNILTHLKYQRIQTLVDKGANFTEANEQAQNELLQVFGLQEYSKNDATLFSIAGGTDEAAVLIAISSLMMIERSEAEVTEYLAKLCKDFGESGTLSDENRQQIEKDKLKLINRLADVKYNIINRYADLGMSVEVKDLTPYFDWDADGIAGNETLKEGEEVVLETTQLNVPNEGGIYHIKVMSPIPVYLELKTSSIGGTSSYATLNLYDETSNTNISVEKTMTDGILTINVAQLGSRTTKTSTVNLYDCLGTSVGCVNIVQEGCSDASIPLLSEDGKSVVSNIVSYIATSFSNLNLLEQYYHYNKSDGLVNRYVNSSNSNINEIWQCFYYAINRILMIKYFDLNQENVYQDYCNVFSALCYYYMITAWGDLPYIDNYDPYSSGIVYYGRTDQHSILDSLKVNLNTAIGYLEEKKNKSLDDENDYFFLSKDVARILLADIYMYQGDYASAQPLLNTVIENGFYSLDDTNYSEINSALSSEETIFAANAMTTRATVGKSSLISVMNYTEVMFSYAECLYKNGNLSKAKDCLDRVIAAKGITVSYDDVLDGIKEARMQLMLYGVGNFAFLKRNNLAVEVYGLERNVYLLFPIPESELRVNPSLAQNPGY